MSRVMGAKHLHAMGVPTEHKIHWARRTEFLPQGLRNGIENTAQLPANRMRISLVAFCFLGDIGRVMHRQNPAPDRWIAMGCD